MEELLEHDDEDAWEDVADYDHHDEQSGDSPGVPVAPKKLYNFGKRQDSIETTGEATGKALFSLAAKYGVAQGFFDEAVKIFNHYISGFCEPLPSHHLTKKVCA